MDEIGKSRSCGNCGNNRNDYCPMYCIHDYTGTNDNWTPKAPEIKP